MWEGRVAHDTGHFLALTFGQWSIIESEAARRQFWALSLLSGVRNDRPADGERINLDDEKFGGKTRSQLLTPSDYLITLTADSRDRRGGYRCDKSFTQAYVQAYGLRS
jgi:hypothetical protein